jgi:hypothetical protein
MVAQMAGPAYFVKVNTCNIFSESSQLLSYCYDCYDSWYTTLHTDVLLQLLLCFVYRQCEYIEHVIY